MRSSILVTILLALLTSLAVAQGADGDVALTLSRTPCFGTCPVYTVTVYQDGTVIFEGQDHVSTIGTHTLNIDPDVVQELVNGFVDAGYFDWNDEYIYMAITDMPYVITSVTHNGETKQINHYLGDSRAPLALSSLEAWVDFVIGTNLLTGSDVPIVGFTEEINPIVTLERGECFGFCPVYNLVLYSDGTVVYMGIKNVDVVGIRIHKIEADMVTSLAERMALTGYFDWQNEYNNRLITDHPTATTSLTWHYDYKRIFRYDGDPNAPLGLFRIEQEIDNLVNISQWIGETPQ